LYLGFDHRRVSTAAAAVQRSIRATFDSLLNQNVPVLGSVIRRWAEEILDLREGSP
jgi:hypothetical protein